MSTSFNCTTIFCDDLRHELNGKLSLMGIYSVDMYVPDFPVTIPKICSFFELHLPPNLENSADAVITVMKGAEKISSITITLPPSVREEESRHGKPYAFKRVVGAMEFPTITFTEPTLLEVVAQVDAQSVVDGRLWVTKFPRTEEASITG